MLARTVRQAARTTRPVTRAALQSNTAPRTYATKAEETGPHQRSSSVNSVAVGSGVVGAMLLAGYLLGIAGDHSKREEAMKKVGAMPEASKSSKPAEPSKSSKSASSPPKVVAKKAEEAAESMPTKSSTKTTSKKTSKSTSASSSSTSSSSSSDAPTVSATGATVPLAGLSEPESASASSSPDSSAPSTPGSIGEGEEYIPPSEEDADPSSAAFNPETGEINWDCPCLGGMAHGVCGEDFKAAFSCFVYSQEEPKGGDCIDKFKAMQECFRAHPEIYGEESAGEDDDDEPSSPSSQSEESEYDIIDAVEAALGATSKSS